MSDSFFGFLLFCTSEIFKFFIYQFLRIYNAACDTLTEYQSTNSSFGRKHGRWKPRFAFPSSFLVLSTICLSAVQVSAFVSNGLHSVAHLPRLNRSHLPRKRVRSTFTDWIPFFNDHYSLSNDPDNFYVPDLFDFVFQDCNAANDCSNPSKYLHLNGTLSSEAWLDYLKKNPILDQPSDDSFDVLRFGSIETFRIDTPLQDIPDIVVKELLSLPSELVTLCPTAALTHDTSFSHLLRNSNSNAKTIDPDKPGTFVLLVDSG